MATSYNVSQVSAPHTLNIFCPTDKKYPNCDAEGATHLHVPVRRNQVALRDVGKWLAETCRLADLVVGDKIAILAIPSDSTIESIGYGVDEVTGIEFKLSTVNGAVLDGDLHSRIACVSTKASGTGVDVGKTVGRFVLIPTDKPYVGNVDYLQLEITKLPADWATCPVFPMMNVVVNWFNHLTSWANPYKD